MDKSSAAVTAMVRELFDAKATTWSAKYASGGPLASRLAHLAGAVRRQAPSGGAVLDLGCGTGDLAWELARSGFQVTGCDISAQMLSQAASEHPPAVIEWVRLEAEWQKLPFLPNCFDTVVASSVLEYVSDPAAILRECGRVLRPGGFMLCTVPNSRHPVRWVEWAVGRAARAPLQHALRHRSPRLNAYLTYLTISRQRHGTRWWAAAGLSAGLHVMACPSASCKHGALHHLTLQKTSTARGHG